MRRWIIFLCLLSLASLACATDDNLVRLIRAFERANWGYHELAISSSSQFIGNYRDSRYPSSTSRILETDSYGSSESDMDETTWRAYVRYHRHTEGERRNLDWTLRPMFRWYRAKSNNTYHDSDDTVDQTSSEATNATFDCDLLTDYREYWTGDYYLAVNLDGSYHQTNREQDQIDAGTEKTSDRDEDTHSYSLNPRVGIGYGRMRDVTNVVRAKRMSDRLMQANGISLTDEQILTLAQYLDEQPAYQAVFSFDNSSDYHFWQDAITQLGLESLTFDQFLYITQEARQNTLLKRQQGRLIEFGITGAWSNRTDEYTEYSDTQTRERDTASFGLYGQYETAKNLSTCQQIRFTLPVELVLQHYEYTYEDTLNEKYEEIENKATVFSVSPEVEHLYQITDRLGVTSSAMLEFSTLKLDVDGAQQQSIIDFCLQCDGAYYLSDSVVLIFSATYDNVQYCEDLLSDRHKANENWRLDFSFSWRPLRSML